MTPFGLKHRIDHCFALARDYGFELREYGNQYESGAIYLYASRDNPVFAQDICLERFLSWDIAEAYLAGYSQCELFHKATGKK